MANDKAFKIKNGLSATKYLSSTGTETSGSEGYDLVGASYDSISFDVSTQDTAARGVAFKSDGTSMYIVGDTNNRVFKYNLSTAWDVSTATYNSSFLISGETSSAQDIYIKSDGLSFWVTDVSFDSVFQYSMSTAWDITSASYDSKSFSVSSQETNPYGLWFKPDGTKMYICGTTGDDVNEYSLSTAWDVSTASFTTNFSLSATGETSPTSVVFKPDGTSMFIIGLSTDTIHEYTLSTSWDLSTATYYTSFPVTPTSTAPYSFVFSTDGTKMYVLEGASTDVVHQYSTDLQTEALDLSTGHTFSFTSSSTTVVSFTNPPASGTATGFTVEINNTGGYAITWPSSVKWHLGTAPTATSTKEVYAFVTTDGGTTYYGIKAGGSVA